MTNENNKALYIEQTTQTECRISITPETDAYTALQLLGTLTAHILDAYSQAAIQSLNPLESTTQAAFEGIKLSLVDSLNTVVTNVINNFDPTRQSFIDQIEEQAIIQLTNEKVEEYYNSLPAKDKEEFTQSYNQMKAALELKIAEASNDSQTTHS